MNEGAGPDVEAQRPSVHSSRDPATDGGPAPHFVYVLALLFTPDGRRVVLMRRTRPAWQAGRVNALGGKLLPGESAAAAASREVYEEAGVRVPAGAWRELVVWRDPVYRMHVLSAFHDAAERARTAEDQEVFLADVGELPRESIENLRWMIPLALDRDVALPLEVWSANPKGSGLTEPPPD